MGASSPPHPDRAAANLGILVNPIEKLWRKLRQEVTLLHRWADDLTALRTQVDHFLEQFAHGSVALLRYVGLKIPD